MDSTAQTGHAGATDWQEDCHQKIQSMKELYFTELSEFHQKIAQNLQQHEALMPPGKRSEQYDKLKSFKAMVERILTLLQISKLNIPVGMKEKLPAYEKQIVTMLQNHRFKKATPQPQAQQFQHPGGSHSMPQQQPSQVTQLQQPDNHGNQLQQINMQGSGSSMQSVGGSGMQHVSMPLPTHFAGSTTQQNISNALQPGSSIDAVQGSSYNSLQPGSIASGQQGGVGSLQNAVSAPQRNTLSLNAGNNLQSSISPMQSSSNLLQQATTAGTTSTFSNSADEAANTTAPYATTVNSATAETTVTTTATTNAAENITVADTPNAATTTFYDRTE